LENLPELSSMSWCKLKNINQSNLDSLAYDLELQLILRDVTARFVSLEQYLQLLFVLGQEPHNAPEQSCQEVLTLFNKFPTDTVDNFMDMIHRLEFPYVYDDQKSLSENRRDFKDFFSCLTNIRCAVVEGGHCCEAACRNLQGYELHDLIPLQQKSINVPSYSTLFKPVSTQVYFCQDKDKILDGSVLKYLRGISEKVAFQKNLIVQTTWHNFFDRVLADINTHDGLQKELYETEANFFAEEVLYKNINTNMVRSNLIKKYLHEILTNAIFNYSPCKDLLDVFDENHKPKSEDWGTHQNKWLSLSAKPFQHVSVVSSELFNIEFHLTHLIFSSGTIYTGRSKSVLPAFFQS
jgi:hypothetical protein